MIGPRGKEAMQEHALTRSVYIHREGARFQYQTAVIGGGGGF